MRPLFNSHKLISLIVKPRMLFSRLKIHEDLKFDELYDLEEQKTEVKDFTHLMEMRRQEDGRYLIEKPYGDDEFLKMLGRLRRNQYSPKGKKKFLLCY